MTEEILKILDEMAQKLGLLENVVNARIDKLKKIIGDYLDLTANISLSAVKTSLKSV